MGANSEKTKLKCRWIIVTEVKPWNSVPIFESNSPSLQPFITMRKLKSCFRSKLPKLNNEIWKLKVRRNKKLYGTIWK
jgi:hypothetical protein